MSHLADAPLLRHRRHFNANNDNLKTRQTFDYQPRQARDFPLNDSSSPYSSSSSSSRQLKTLLLPAQLEIRRISKRKRENSPSHKRFETDSSFHVHQLLPRQSVSTSTQAQINQALEGVTAETDCRELVVGYEGPAPAGRVRRFCFQAVAEARAAQEAVNSSSSQAAAATRTRSRATRTAQLQTITLSSAPTGNVNAPITSLNPSQSLASAVSSRFSAAEVAASSVAAASSVSRASIQSSVESLFSEAYSEVSSRRAAATASSTASSSIPSSSSASSSAPSSSSALPSATSSGTEPSATAAPARSGNNRNLARIIAPSVIVPIAVLLLLLLAFCLWRRKRRRAGTGAGGLPPISNPQPLRAAPRQYGAAGAGAGAGALAGAGAAGAAAAAAGRGAGDSQESFGTTPSAIGVAFSEPKTRWGRRSLVDVLAGGVRASSPDDASSPSPVAGASFSGAHSRSPTFGHAGKQPSISSVASEYRGVGGYNSHTGYQPGQMRPVVSPLAQYDPFGPGSIVAVPAAAQRHTSSDSSRSGYDDELASARSRSAGSDSLTAQLAPPLAAGYAHAPVAQQSRTTQTSTEGAYDGYCTADPGFTSGDSFAGEDDDPTEMLSEEGGYRGSPGEEEAVNFGSGSSGSGSRSGRSNQDPQATPRVESTASTPRLGVGHGSGIGVRRNDGTGSWWN
ncbi:hypothetical protein JCM11251_002173 [Rhodosporidiobolus azoricus]